METQNIETCTTCSKPLPANGFFCGGCLSQFKCKSCGSPLDKDNAGCTNCGTPKEMKNNATSSQGFNTFRLHETSTDRTIEATFSDNVGKDLAGMLRDTYAIKAANQSSRQIKQLGSIAINSEIGTENYENVEEVVNQEPVQQKQSIQVSQPASPPTLKAIAMKNLPSSETEWIVVYAFFASDYGNEIFTRQDLIDKYTESNRNNKDRMRDLAAYIRAAVKANYLNPLETGYSILEKGVEKAKEILSRTSGSAPKYKPTAKDKKEEDNSDVSKGKKSSAGGKHLKRLTNINFEPSGKESLNDFISKYTPKNDNERNLLFVFYLREILKLQTITFDHIYTCYDTLNLRISENLPQTVRNTASRTGWIETKNANIMTTVKGNNQIKAWNKQN